MIGDWVQFSYHHHETGEPVVRVFQVTQIEAQLGDYYVWSEAGRVCHPEQLIPIPLTPEILEKNGFDGAYKKTYQIYKSNGYDKLYISYWRGRLTIITSPDIRKKHSTNTIHIDCSYVHELQHCLALFGIEKEIEL